MRSRLARTITGVIVGAAIVAGSASAATPAALPGAPTALPGVVTPVPGAPTPRVAWVAHIEIPIRARTAPGGGEIRTTIPTNARWTGSPLALLVLGARVTPDGTTWLRVLLPQRPNGASAWIDSDYVQLTRTPWRIDVSLRTRTVSLLRGGRRLRRWRAVIGKPSTPTPSGLYAIYESVRQPDPQAFLGSWALLLTAFSPVLNRFDGGPGEVAIHGRGSASLLDPLGSARSHGCVRVDNGTVDVLVRDAAVGTPVQIS